MTKQETATSHQVTTPKQEVSTTHTPATASNEDITTRIVYVANNGQPDVYWYSLDRLRRAGANMNKVIEMTAAQAIAKGKHHSKIEK